MKVAPGAETEAVRAIYIWKCVSAKIHEHYISSFRTDKPKFRLNANKTRLPNWRTLTINHKFTFPICEVMCVSVQSVYYANAQLAWMINEYLFSIIDKMFLIWLYHRQPSNGISTIRRQTTESAVGTRFCVRRIFTISLCDATYYSKYADEWYFA